MRAIPFLFNLVLTLVFVAKAQVTPLIANKGLRPAYVLNQNKVVLVSVSFNRLWVSDGTAAGTVALSDTLTYEGAGGVLNGALVFAASSPSLGSELWITDGTVNGTRLLKDIHPGKESAAVHDNFALLNGFLYFSATAPGIGRELWRTNGTPEGTTLVKDLIPGPAGSGLKGTYKLFSTGTYLLFTIPTYTEGYELWRSDGTADGTYMLKDINPGMPSSDITAFQVSSNGVLFSAKTAAQGTELWKTDGTPAGTELVKDIRAGTGSSLNHVRFYPVNGKLLFVADDGGSGEEFWVTDGTESGTVLLKDIEAGADRSYVSLSNLVQVGAKLVFPAYNHTSGTELWETDGTPAGTKMFHEVLPGIDGGIIQLLPNASVDRRHVKPLFTGNQFFFLLGLPLGGVELWKSDGTFAGTAKVKTLRATDNTIGAVSVVYTPGGVYFSFNDGVNGNEIWKSDGTMGGTALFADINKGACSSDVLFSYLQAGNHILLEANDGDGSWQTDLYRLDAALTIPLPVKLGEFTAALQGGGALLTWYTLQEEGARDFLVERSDDGAHFRSMGTVAAKGNSTNKMAYSFLDATVAGSGKEKVYYRLQLRDADGRSTQSGVVVLKVGGRAERNVHLLGNPVQGDLKLAVSGIAGSLRLSIKDASGKTVRTAAYKGDASNISLPAKGLAPGTYFLLAEGGGRNKTIKFIKL